MGVPLLPVIIKGCLIIRTRTSHNYIRQSKQIRQTGTFHSSFHHTHMGNKISGHIKAGKLDTVTVAFYFFKKSCSNPFRCLSFFVSRKHTVNIRIISRPEALSYINRIVIYMGNHKDLIAIYDRSPFF